MPYYKKGFAHILLLGLLASLLILGTFVYRNQNIKTPAPQITSSPQPTPDETSTWKTYTNTDLGITFLYPDGYVLTNDSFYPSDFKGGIGAGAILIEAQKNKNQYTNCNYEDDYKKDAKVLSKQTVTVNSISGIQELVETRFLGDNGEGFAGALFVNNFCFNKSGKSFTLSFYYRNNQPDVIEQSEFNQVLSTFKFTSPTPTSTQIMNTSTWKTVTYYGISLKIPPSWATDKTGRDSGPYALTIFDDPTFNGYAFSLELLDNVVFDNYSSYKDSKILKDKNGNEYISQTLTRTASEGGSNKTYVTKLGEIVYKLTTTGTLTEDKMQYFDSIFSTFTPK